MVDELFTTPRSPIFAICTLDFIWRIKVTKHVLKPTSKGICDNLSMRIDMECGDQVCNALLYHLSTSILVNENGCSGGLALTVHNLLIWVYRLILIIRNPGIRRVRLDFFLSIDLSSEEVEDAIDPALELKLKLLSSIDASGSHPLRLMAQDSAIALSSCLRSSSLMSSSSSEGGTNSREIALGGCDFIELIVVPKAQRVGGLRGPHLNSRWSVNCLDWWRTFVCAITKKRMQFRRLNKRMLDTL